MSFRNPRLLEKTNYVKFDLNTTITLPGNNAHQVKTGYKFTTTDRSNWYDWYNAYFHVGYTLEATADGAAIAGDTRSSTINGSFSLLGKLVVKSSGKSSGTSMRQANGTLLISPGIKDAKHVFLFIQQTRKLNALTQNPYFFYTFNIDGDDSAKLATCKLQFGTDGLYPELDYDEGLKLRILNDLINYRYRRNDYNTGVQLYQSNFGTLYPVICFDLRENKENITNEPRQLTFHYRLNEAADAQDYICSNPVWGNTCD